MQKTLHLGALLLATQDGRSEYARDERSGLLVLLSAEDGVTVQVSLCLFGVNEIKVKKMKIRYYIVLERAQGPTLLDCNYAGTCLL